MYGWMDGLCMYVCLCTKLVCSVVLVYGYVCVHFVFGSIVIKLLRSDAT